MTASSMGPPQVGAQSENLSALIVVWIDEWIRSAASRIGIEFGYDNTFLRSVSTSSLSVPTHFPEFLIAFSVPSSAPTIRRSSMLGTPQNNGRPTGSGVGAPEVTS